MGTTCATLAKELAPELNITILERLESAGEGNSWVFNNAGTGHEANCELNYTPVDEEVISVEKALKIHAQFNVAKQFWAHLIKKARSRTPRRSSIRPSTAPSSLNPQSTNCDCGSRKCLLIIFLRACVSQRISTKSRAGSPI
jgi:hypothetical protein